MASDITALILHVNLALAAGVAVVMALRHAARTWFGARVAYSFWILPLLAAAACFLPARVEHIVAAQTQSVPSTAAPLALTLPPEVVQSQPMLWLYAWCAGVVLSLAILVLRQGRFARALGRLRPRADLGAGVFGAESCAHGPAVVGVLRPFIVTPADFDQRFSDEERRIVLAHERAHLAQGDPLINALVVTLQCLNWFNPFVHLAARALRVDQELAADAAVLTTAARRSYAEAILKTQIIAAAPLGSAWPPHSAQSLKERIAMLKRTLPSRTQRIIGVSAVAVASLAVCAAAWSAQPAHVVVSKAPSIARSDAAPFIEPPVSDPSQLAGGPQSSDEWTEAAANERADISKADDNSDDESDESVDDTPDEPNTAEADDDSSDDSEVIIGGEHVDARHLTPQQRERVHAAIAQARIAAQQARAAARVAQSQAVRQAMAQSRAAIAEARSAARDAQAEGMRAAREAQAESIRTAVEAAREVNSPAMQAEIRAITAETAQVARDVRMTEAQRQEMRADIRAHVQRLRNLSHSSCRRTHSSHDSHDEHEQQND